MESSKLKNNNVNSVIQSRWLPARIITNNRRRDGCSSNNGGEAGTNSSSINMKKATTDLYAALLYNNNNNKDDDNVIIEKNYFNGNLGTASWIQQQQRKKSCSNYRKNKFYEFLKKMLLKRQNGFDYRQAEQQQTAKRVQEKSPESNLVINNEKNERSRLHHRPSLARQLENLLGTNKSDDKILLIEHPSLPSPAVEAVWFNASLTRDSASQQLKTKEIGSFIVRKSAKDNCYALSIQAPSTHGGGTKIIHYLIQQTEVGYRIKGSTKEFSTLQALVTHHSVMKEKLPVPLLLLPSAKAKNDDKQKRKVKDYESIESLDKILDEIKIR